MYKQGLCVSAEKIGDRETPGAENAQERKGWWLLVYRRRCVCGGDKDPFAEDAAFFQEMVEMCIRSVGRR